MNRLIASFYQLFDIVSADNPLLLNEAFRLRFQVLCAEKHVPGFEPEKFPGGLETDEHDANACHNLLLHRVSGRFVGTVRLILCDPHDPSRPFPIEKNCAHSFDRSRFDPACLPRRRTAEISRLVILPEFRSRCGEGGTRSGDPSSSTYIARERRKYPHPFLGLLTAIMRMTAEHNITHWYAGMEPALNKSLARIGVQLDPIGPLVEYHGLRQPYVGVVGQVMDRLYREHHETWELLTEGGRLWEAPPQGPFTATGV